MLLRVAGAQLEKRVGGVPHIELGTERAVVEIGYEADEAEELLLGLAELRGGGLRPHVAADESALAVVGGGEDAELPLEALILVRVRVGVGVGAGVRVGVGVRVRVGVRVGVQVIGLGLGLGLGLG